MSNESMSEFVTARKVMADAFSDDPDFKRVYVDNVGGEHYVL